MRTAIFSFFGLFAFSFSFATPLSAADHTKDTLDVVKKNLVEKKAVIVDVRSDKEWEAGHLEGAIHLPITEIEKVKEDKTALTKLLADKLPKDKIIYVHCGAGGRAKKACTIGEASGFDLRGLKPGYQALVDAGLEKAKVEVKK